MPDGKMTNLVGSIGINRKLLVKPIIRALDRLQTYLKGSLGFQLWTYFPKNHQINLGIQSLVGSGGGLIVRAP